MPRFYYVANWLLPKAMRVMRVTLQVNGIERVPTSGPLLIVSNHVSVLDPPLVGYAMPRDVVFMSKIENFQGGRFYAWLVRNYGAFPVRRGDVDLSAIKQALQILKEERALFVAPEGTRHSDGVLGEAQHGVAMLAARADAVILPLGLHGGHHAEQRMKRWQPIAITMNIGHPFRLRLPEGRARRDYYPAITDAIMEQVAQLLPAEYRGRFPALTEAQRFIRDDTGAL